MLTLIVVVLAFAVILGTCDTGSEKEDQTAELDRLAEKASAPRPLPDMSVQEKKARFRDLVLPPVRRVHDELATLHANTRLLVEGDPSALRLADLRGIYKAETNVALLAAIKPHPISITLAQAAMESAWGTSRFFREANNIFGIWATDESEPHITAAEKRGDRTIRVKKYDSLEASVRDYYLTLARGKAFGEFRALRLSSDDPHALVKKLDRYSERGAAYGEELSSMIRYNDFSELDG